MAIAFDPYSYLNYERQRRATGQPGLSPAQIESLGYGVVSAQADRALQGRQTALQERSVAASERATEANIANASRQLQLQEDALKQQKYASIASGALSIPTSLAMIEMLTRGKGTSGWIGSGVKALTGGKTTSAITKPGVESTAALPGSEAYMQIPEPGWGEAGMGTGWGTETSAGAVSGMEAGWEIPQAIHTGGDVTSSLTGTSAGLSPLGYAGAAATVAAGAYKVGQEFMKDPVGTAVYYMFGGSAATGLKDELKGVAKKVENFAEDLVGGTVICSELRRQHLVSQELFDYEARYQSNFSWETYWGYRFWADRVVRAMQRSRLVTQVFKILGTAFLTEIAHRVEPTHKGSLLGSFILKVGVPLCKWNYNRCVKRYKLLEVL